jgi:hypothetical protein
VNLELYLYKYVWLTVHHELEVTTHPNLAPRLKKE